MRSITSFADVVAAAKAQRPPKEIASIARQVGQQWNSYRLVIDFQETSDKIAKEKATAIIGGADEIVTVELPHLDKIDSHGEELESWDL